MTKSFENHVLRSYPERLSYGIRREARFALCRAFFLEVPIFLGNSSGVLEEARFTVYNTSGDVSNGYVELLISISRNPS